MKAHRDLATEKSLLVKKMGERRASQKVDLRRSSGLLPHSRKRVIGHLALQLCCFFPLFIYTIALGAKYHGALPGTIEGPCRSCGSSLLILGILSLAAGIWHMLCLGFSVGDKAIVNNEKHFVLKERSWMTIFRHILVLGILIASANVFIKIVQPHAPLWSCPKHLIYPGLTLSGLFLVLSLIYGIFSCILCTCRRSWDEETEDERLRPLEDEEQA